MMNWFLVILFMNPAIQSYDVADGWYPLPYASEMICDMKLDFMNMYLTGTKHIVECVQAPGMWAAIATMKEHVNE